MSLSTSFTTSEIKEDTFLDFLFNEDPYNSKRVGGPVKPTLIIIAYIIFVKFLGPSLMKDAKAFKLKTAMIIYNFSLVLLNVYVSFNLFRILMEGWIEIGICGWGHADQYTRDYTIRVFKYIWLYYLSKYVDLLDTVFFILRKKQNQVTFLHVFHHVVMVVLVRYTCLHQGSGSSVALSFGLNAFVHVVMYGYYGITACGSQAQKLVLPYKKYLTLTQLVQFVIIEASIIGCARNPEWTRIIWIWFLAALIILFMNFYMKTYLKTKAK